MPGSAVNPTLDIIDTILEEASFRSLLSALQAVRMVDQLKGSGPFTLFAPTDEAFEKLAAGSLLQLEKPENAAKLKHLLEGHIMQGRHSVDYLRQRLTVESLTGGLHNVVSSATGVTVGGAHLQGHGIDCTNGIIHVVDSVLQTA